MKLTLAALALALAALAAPAAAGPPPTLKPGSSPYGRVVYDGRGFALYAFTRDHGRSACSGACAKAWPPYIAPKARLRVAPGLKRALLGTVRRADGRRQVTYAKRPLYFYVGDTKRGRILCQDVFEYGGRWLVLRPSGKLVR